MEITERTDSANNDTRESTQAVRKEMTALRRAYGRSAIDKFSHNETLRRVCGAGDLLDGFVMFERSILADNLQTVTAREKVESQNHIELMAETDLQLVPREFPNFSVEMETGTDKTYVYIATALRMAELYGLREFVVTFE